MFRFSFLATIFFCSVATSVAKAETFVWEAKKATFAKALPRVILSNNVIVELAGAEGTFERSISAASLDSNQKKTLIKNDWVEISASYPSADKASVVILKDACSGSICRWTNVTVLVPHGKFVKTYTIDDPSKVTLTIKNGQLMNGRAEGVLTGVDEYGGERQVALSFVPSAGFVLPNFKREYAKLIGEHPDKFFADEVLRKPLVQAVGLEVFRDLRRAIRVASPSAIVNNRYIVMQGCVPHDCGGNYGFLMIDGLTADLFWARYNDSKNLYSGATTKADKSQLQQILASDEVSQYSDVKLTITSDGTIAYRSK
jgi:hypothetical protein